MRIACKPGSEVPEQYLLAYHARQLGPWRLLHRPM